MIGHGAATLDKKDLLVTSADGAVTGGIPGMAYAHTQHVGIQQGFSQI